MANKKLAKEMIDGVKWITNILNAKKVRCLDCSTVSSAKKAKITKTKDDIKRTYWCCPKCKSTNVEGLK